MSDTSESIKHLSEKQKALFKVLLEERKKAQSASSPQPIQRREIADSYPLSFAQERLWFLHQLDPENAAFNVHVAEQLKGRLDVTALERALAEIVRRHDAMRTTFAVADGQSVQVIAPAARFDLSVVDITEVSQAARMSTAYRLATEQANRCFDLMKGPLLRATLLRLEEREHVLLLTTHHIVSDGWSMDILLRELAVLYDAFASGRKSPLPELPIRYVDFAQWQRERLQGEVLEELAGYWKKQLAAPLPLLQMPTDWPRPPVQSMQGANKLLKLSKPSSDSLAALCRKEGVTLFMLMLAIFDTLLHRYTGQSDIIVGTPIANRNRSETQGVLGVFINMVALRIDNSGSPVFRELLRKVKDLTWQAFAHEDLPFEKLVEELQPERDPSRHPIFQAMLVQQNASDESIDLPGLRLSPLEVETGTAQLDLTLFFLEGADGLLLSMDYDTSLFSSETISRLLTHVEVLLGEVIKNPERRLHELVMLTAEETDQLLVKWNLTGAAFPEDQCIHRMFESQVERTPDACAVSCEDQRLSYRELNSRANQLARHLRKSGVGPESLVGICVERSPEMAVAILGILKAGGAYVPLEPGYPKQRLAFVFEDANLKVLLSQQRLLDLLPQHGAVAICLDSQWNMIAEESDENLDNEADAGNPAYVIYTSGSTGKPKGVSVTHRNLVNSTVARFQYYGETLKGFLLLSSYAFDSSVAGIFWTLCNGATLTIPGEGLHQDLFHVADLLNRQNSSHLLCLPSVYGLLLKQKELGELPALRGVIVAGESCPKEIVEQHARRFPHAALFNEYGPTEGTVWSTVYECDVTELGARLPIGRPISNTRVYLLDEWLNPAPLGVPADLHIGGAGIARGYLNRPGLTAEKFIPNPFSDKPGARLYRTGDLARYRPDGNIEFLRRGDSQVKIRGYRIELEEIEATLAQHPAIREAAVVAEAAANREGGDRESLTAYLVSDLEPSAVAGEMREYLRERLPHYMIPSGFILLAELPLNVNGKVDRQALSKHSGQRLEIKKDYEPPRTRAERIIASAWLEVLRIEKAGVNDNFFDLGGHSLLLTQVHRKLRDSLGGNITLLDLLRYPTISSLARYISPDESGPSDAIETITRAETARPSIDRQDSSVAIIGMSARLPGAKNVEEFWANLRDGIESISVITDEELRSSGVADHTLSASNYVRAGGVIDDVEMFDASFFGFNPREAQVTDPQHRVFLECAYEALENAGYTTDKRDRLIGLYAGAGTSTYWRNLFSNRDFRESATDLQAKIGNEKDHLTTRVSYKLNLRGPSVAVQTTCSSSLVAVHMACRSLLNGECDIALAGGVSISIPQMEGYFYEEGGINSPDGHCRAFDAKAQGTVAGNGAGIVALKRLADARADGDNILAVIKGTAINNDGSLKIGYTAPSIDGQAEVIAKAHAVAGSDPRRVGYIEAHGTGTSLGDPIEIAALTKVFRAKTDRKQFCAIGSVKTNIGHLDAAAGVAGLIKTVLALNHKKLPPSLHYEEPNPQIDFETSPFYVNAKLSEWNGEGLAGVSSFGIGGTNAHAVIEPPPLLEESTGGRPKQLLVLSAKTSTALDSITENLAEYLTQHPDLNFEDVAYTLQAGRAAYDHRRIVVCEGLHDAVASLKTFPAKKVFTSDREPGERPVVFLFPGQGAQYPNMGLELYRAEPAFRASVDRCCDHLHSSLGFDLRDFLYPSESDLGRASERLNQTLVTQTAVFVVEYALAQLWMEWGVKPQAMVGHSIGEYVAACLAGVFSIEDALSLVATRARLMQELPPGAMLSVALPGERAQSLLDERLSLAAVNGPASSVVSGPTEAIDELEARLRQQDIECRRLRTSHAFHSAMMAPVAEALTEEARKLEPRAPRIAYMSNVTGTWITNQDATDPRYWGKHLRQTVRFGESVGELLRTPDSIFLEVGPGQALSALIRRRPERDAGHSVLASLPHPDQAESELGYLLKTLGQLWLQGVTPNWVNFNSTGRRHRVALPTYPFERKRYWVEAQEQNLGSHTLAAAEKKTGLSDWFYLPFWKPSLVLLNQDSTISAEESSPWMIFVDQTGLGEKMADRLRQMGRDVFVVRAAESFEILNEREFTINCASRDDYTLLLGETRARAASPGVIAHFWNVTCDTEAQSSSEFSAKILDSSFYSLMFLAQALGEQSSDDQVLLGVFSNNMQAVAGGEIVCPEKATLLGPCKVIPKEIANITCRSIDVDVSQRAGSHDDKLLDNLLAELTASDAEPVVAYRGNRRWVPAYEQVELGPSRTPPDRLREGGVYLITGGAGGIGLELAKYLSRTLRAKLALLGRSSVDDANGSLRAAEGDFVSPIIGKLRELEDLGAEVMYLTADVTNQDELREAIARTRARFGPINGVIHAAGIPGEGLILAKTAEMAAAVLAPRIRGTRAIADLMRNENLDFFLLCGSLSSILGGVGQIDYCAANAYLDAFAHYNTVCNETFTVSVDWDTWLEVGMAARALNNLSSSAQRAVLGVGSPEVLDGASNTRQEIPAEGILPEQGAEIFSRILSISPAPQIVISRGDLQTSIREANSFTQARVLEALETLSSSGLRFPRPSLRTPYVAPRNQTEMIIAEMWQQVLGISEIGIDDDFFELGGDSLLTIQIISRMRQSFNVEPKVRDIFEASTVARFAEMIDRSQKDCAKLTGPAIRPVSREGYRVEMSSREALALPEALRRKA